MLNGYRDRGLLKSKEIGVTSTNYKRQKYNFYVVQCNTIEPYYLIFCSEVTLMLGVHFKFLPVLDMSTEVVLTEVHRLNRLVYLPQS